jgi:hypothetical protein
LGNRLIELVYVAECGLFSILSLKKDRNRTKKSKNKFEAKIVFWIDYAFEKTFYMPKPTVLHLHRSADPIALRSFPA